MRKGKNMKTLILLMILSVPNLLWASDEVLIEAPSLAAALGLIHESLEKVTSSVMICIDSGNKHSKCMCQNKSIIIKFNNTVKSVLGSSNSLKTSTW